MSKPSSSADLADLADLVLNVAHHLRARTPTGGGVVPLNQTERMVMRIVDLYPDCTPGEIARRISVRPSNISAALRDLEAKQMLVRTAAGGRRVTVRATAAASTNLARLRAGWSDQLSGADLDHDQVRSCARLLADVETHLNGTSDSPPTSHNLVTAPRLRS